MKVAVYYVYTGVIGEPGAVLPEIPDNPFFDYYFFTNNSHLFKQAQEHPFFVARWLDEETPDAYSANMACKTLKAMPHKASILKTYDYTVYLDTKISFGVQNWGVTITEEFIRDTLYKTRYIRMFKHTSPRGSVFDELEEALQQERYAKDEDRIRRYIAEKREEQFTDWCDNFMQTTYIFRNMKEKVVEEIGEHWYNEIQRCGIECQIAWHYTNQQFKEFISPLNRDPNLHFDYLEIGTSDFDTFTERYPDKKVISVEPMQQYLDALPQHSNHIKVRSAICERYEETSPDIYYISDDDIRRNNLAWWLRGCNKIGSIHPKHEGLEHLVKKQRIHFMTLDDLFKRYNIKKVDNIKIDTEGYEVPILRALYKRLLVEKKGNYPKTIMYEVNENSDSKQMIEVTTKLISLGYKLESFDEDIVLSYGL